MEATRFGVNSQNFTELKWRCFRKTSSIRLALAHLLGELRPCRQYPPMPPRPKYIGNHIRTIPLPTLRAGGSQEISINRFVVCRKKWRKEVCSKFTIVMIVTCQLVASSCYVSTSMTGIIQQYQALYVCSPPPQPLQGHDLDFDRCSQSASKQIDWTEYTSCELDDGCPVAAHFGCNKARENTLKASVQTCFSMRNSRHASSSCQLMWGQKSLSSLRHLARRILQAKEPWWPGFWPSKSCEYRNVGFNQNKKQRSPAPEYKDPCYISMKDQQVSKHI